MAVLIWGDTIRNPALRHEVPIGVIDPFLYLESDAPNGRTGRTRAVVASAIEKPRLEELDGLEVIGHAELGIDELIETGRELWDIELELGVRAVKHLGLESAVVPAGFPLALAERLRAEGVEIAVDEPEFIRRRRAKNDSELAGIRRAQRAADAAMARAAALLRDPGAGGRLSAELVRAEMQGACRQLDCTLAHDAIVAPGAQGAIGHEAGHGPLPESTTIIVDIWPCDDASGCYADMTRTFVLGDVPAEIAEWHELTRTALERAREAVRPGVAGRAVYDIACEVYEAAGHPTQRTKEQGETLREGFFHSLGHGVGLDVHEEPLLGRAGSDELIPGDVVTLEPGTYRQGFGGVRLEDLVLVTDDGCETLTDFPYELEPQP